MGAGGRGGRGSLSVSRTLRQQFVLLFSVSRKIVREIAMQRECGDGSA